MSLYETSIQVMPGTTQLLSENDVVKYSRFAHLCYGFNLFSLDD